jgi:hypothetical protein
VVSVTDTYGLILGFLDRSRSFLSSSSSVVLTRLNGPCSKPTTFFPGSAGNRTRVAGSVAKNSDQIIVLLIQFFASFESKQDEPKSSKPYPNS